MTRVLDAGNQNMGPESYALPVAPMAMPEQVLERPRARGALFASLLKRLAWK